MGESPFVVVLVSFSILTVILKTSFTVGFHHNSCENAVAKQFQFGDCYLPNLAEDLLLARASFLMSHDAGTGYLKHNQGLLANGATNLYAKNQIGDVYEQLDDGARALDVRPKLLSNGTIVLHHGAVPIPVTLERLVTDALRWARDNPDELVLILHSNFAYPASSSAQNTDDYDNEDDAIVPSADTTVGSLSQVYSDLGVNYVECSDLYGLTVGEAMELAAVVSPYSSSDDNEQGGGKQKSGGYLLALNRHDTYAGSCAKQNYVEPLVTCYSNDDSVLPCTNRKSIQHEAIKEYALASANNEPTDNSNIL